MIIEEEVDSTEAMRKKKNEPKEIPIHFVEGEEARPEEQESEEEIPPAIDADSQVARSAEEGPEENQAPDPESAPDIENNSEAALALQSQIDSLMAERSALYDQLLRRQAEFENYRKRTERDKAEFYQRARADVLMEMLPVIDNFERALSSLEKSGSADESFKHGVELIHKQFKDTLTKLGLQPIEAVGRAFDPNLHEAVTMEPTDEHEENTVVEEFERGYKLGDKLLRPAKVKVASSPDR
jgi:molecular chaperone GrpE